jgi:hypothetical protein
LWFRGEVGRAPFFDGREAHARKRTAGCVTADAVPFSRSSLAGRAVHAAVERHEWIAAIVLAVALALGRLPAVLSMHRPTFMWDEAAYLSLGRYLAGAGQLVDLRIASFGRPAYGVVLWPAFAAHSAFETAFHLALLTNLLLGAATTVLAYAIARRIGGVTAPIALLSAAAITAYPSVFLLPFFALSENIVVPLTLGAVLVAYEVISRPGAIVPNVAFALCLVGLWASHPVAGGTVLVALAGLLAAAAVRRIPWAVTALNLLVVLIGVALVFVADTKLSAEGWGAPVGTVLREQLASVATTDGVVRLFRLLAYQQAAVLVPSLGAYAIAVSVLVRELLIARSVGFSARSAVAAFVLVSVVVTAFFSSAYVASLPGSPASPDVLFRTRYLEATIVATLAVGLPMFTEQVPPWRAIGYATSAALVVLTLIADPAFQAGALAASGGSANALALSAYARFLHASSFLFLGFLGLVDACLIVLLRWLRAPLALVALVIVWGVAGAAELQDGIAWQQAQLDALFGVRTSSFGPYLAAVPHDSVPYAASAIDPVVYATEALALPHEHFRVLAPPASDPGTAFVIAAREQIPSPYHIVACEHLAPVCLGMRDAAFADRLISQALSGELVPRPALQLRSGLEIGVNHFIDVTTDGIWGLERTPDGVEFRWTDGDAAITLPAISDRAPATAHLVLVAPDAGHIIIGLQRPGGTVTKIVDAPDQPGENDFFVPLAPYVAGTRLTIVSTNRVGTPADVRRTLSVQIRQLRLTP